MCVKSFLKALVVLWLLCWTSCEDFNVQQASWEQTSEGSQPKLVRVPLVKTSYQPSTLALLENHTGVEGATASRMRTKRQNGDRDSGSDSDSDRDSDGSNEISSSSRFQDDEVEWANFNEVVDIFLPVIVKHLQELQIEYLHLPNMKETITINSLLINYEAGLFLSNGIVYNLEGIERFGDAMMTYKSANKSLLCKFNLKVKRLQFEYDFLVKVLPIEGYGRVIGSLDDTIVFGDLAIRVDNDDWRFKLNDFRIKSFGDIQVQLDHHRILRELSGAILSPITNLFRNRITTSISDGLKEPIQLILDDFRRKDSLGLKGSVNLLLGGLLKGNNSQS